MEKQRIRKFKNRQKRLAKKISDKIGLELESVSYIEYLPGAQKDFETGKIIVEKPSQTQICIPGSSIKPAKYKQRINIIITFKGCLMEFDKKAIDSILKTQYFVFDNKIKYSVNPRNKNSI